MTDDLMGMFAALDNENPEVREAYTRPPINQIGNKFEILDHILPHLPYAGACVDVFGGGGSVTLARRPEPFEVYNDLNSGLIALYKCIQNPTKLDELIDRVRLLPHSRELFIWSKDWADDTDDVIRAARYYYCIQASFVGRGEYFGRTLRGRSNIYQKIQENLQHFDAIHARFRTVQIENLHWRTCFKDFDSHKSVFYCDPPYISGKVYKHGMTIADHAEMAERIFQLEGFVALSGYEHEVYDKHPWTKKIKIPVNNRVQTMAFDSNNGMADKEHLIDRGKPRYEFLYIKDFA